MINLPKNKKIVLFDGVCTLCNNTVKTIIKNDKKDVFVFTSLQSKTGLEIIDYLKIDTTKIDSIILYEPTVAYYIKSDAALKILDDFGGFWSVLTIFWLVPKPFRDVIYSVIAKNRYKWFGKKESCIVPTKELQAKFLS